MLKVGKESDAGSQRDIETDRRAMQVLACENVVCLQ
jgi:hypothetical protein